MITELDREECRVPVPRLSSALFEDVDEALLIDRARNGCSVAIERLIVRYERRVFRLARNITRNHEDTEEVVQNAFLKAFLRQAAFRGDSRFYTWLVRIAVNEALMKVRSRRLKEVSIDDAKDSEDGEEQSVARELQDRGPNPEQHYRDGELRGILETAIGKLAPGYRIVFYLRNIEGLSPEETARALHLSVAAVKSRASRARSQLQNSLKSYLRPKKSKGKLKTFVVGDLRSSNLWQLL
jgi:RNA polymerase sigma-70 factor (ECF subfamily)